LNADISGFLEKLGPEKKTFKKITEPNGLPRKLKKVSTKDPAPETESFASSDADEIQAGVQVEHQKFGTGKVINVEGKGPNKKVTVFFQNVGQKQLLLQFAKLRVVK
jgi:DNA helicase II / ATP-dependent DNA helicase PcrA